MKIDCISDLHGEQPELEGGDLLIIAGDLTARDTKDDLLAFDIWVSKQQYKKTIIIAGNHDNSCVKGYPFTRRRFAVDGIVFPYNDIEYLSDSGTEFEGLKIWGSPWTKSFPGMNPYCKAFVLDTEEELEEKWKLIPSDTDILITHSPPYGTLDETFENKFSGRTKTRINVGSTSLGKELNRIMPRLHVFGHLHLSYGKMECEWPPYTGLELVTFVNAAHLNEDYEAINKPITVIL